MKDLSVLVSSFDKYSDLWDPYFKSLFMFWPRLESRIFLISNNLNYDDKRVETLHFDAQNTWSQSVISALKIIDSEYVLFSLEDFLLKENVINSKIERSLSFIKENNGVVLYLNKNRFSQVKFQPKRLYVKMNKETPYIVSTQAAIWNRRKLLEILNEKESAWEFELNGSFRVRKKLDNFYCINDNIFNYRHHSVERGKWFRSEYNYLIKHGIILKNHARKKMSYYETIIWYVKKFYGSMKYSIYKY